MSDASERAGKSWGFDRAVECYDRTRTLAPEAMEAMLAVLREELAGADPVLEVGAGTGRLSIPLAQGGMRMVGVDLSPLMLEKLVEKAADGPRPGIVVGDATRLPFADDAFGGALLFHVLHLVPNWPDVLREIDRVVQPGGAVVIGLGHLDGRANPLLEEIGATFQEAVGIEHQFPGLVQADPARFDGIVRELGWTRREVPKITDVQSRTPQALIREFEDGVWSWTWDLTEEQRRAAAAVTRERIHERYGDLDAPQTFESRIGVRSYRTEVP